jgi:hypothetical protein
MDSTVKSLIITGTAAEDATRSRQKKATRKRNVVKEDDDDFIEQAKQLAQEKEAQKSQLQKPIINLESKVLLNTRVQANPIQNKQPNKLIESNVILNPPKVQRVKLQPKISHQNQQETLSESLNTTRKARRIHLSSTNLSHRFTRAKRVKEDTEKKPVTSIRDYLVSKGVIQQKSKAPEKMLRSMYSDFMLLKDQAL